MVIIIIISEMNTHDIRYNKSFFAAFNALVCIQKKGFPCCYCECALCTGSHAGIQRKVL